MSRFMHTVRFVVGMALLAGGVVLAQPFVATVIASRQARSSATTDGVAMTSIVPQAAWPTAEGQVPVSAGGHAIPDARPFGNEMPQGFVSDAQSGGFSDLGGRTAGDMAMAAPPPTPPSPLPPSSIDFSPSSPQLTGTYRSTVEIPPPPLLDSQTPPPLAAGWVVHGVSKPAMAPPPSPSAAVEEMQSIYVVRDGDDLTGIALRVYGHAGAATAIWMANRDRLADPQLLPIGLPLRLPPSWTLPATHAGSGASGGTSIEPALGMGGVSADHTAVAAQGRGMAEPSWLRSTVAPAITAPYASGAAAPEAKAGRPASIRVAAGESLDSIAVRFYGDRMAAMQIWQANRDRLRSPDLLVIGMELRLP